MYSCLSGEKAAKQQQEDEEDKEEREAIAAQEAEEAAVENLAKELMDKVFIQVDPPVFITQIILHFLLNLVSSLAG